MSTVYMCTYGFWCDKRAQSSFKTTVLKQSWCLDGSQGEKSFKTFHLRGGMKHFVVVGISVTIGQKLLLIGGCRHSQNKPCSHGGLHVFSSRSTEKGTKQDKRWIGCLGMDLQAEFCIVVTHEKWNARPSWKTWGFDLFQQNGTEKMNGRDLKIVSRGMFVRTSLLVAVRVRQDTTVNWLNVSR